MKTIGILRWLAAALVATAVSLAGPGLSLPASASAAPSQGEIVGFKLTPAQSSALRAAWVSHRRLSASDALQLVESVGRSTGIGAPALAGWAQIQGNCTFDHLEGYSYGSYYWYQQADRVGPTSYGEAAFSTNGFTASVSDFWYGVTSYVSDGGNIVWVGWGATGTTWSGWAVMQNGWFCSGTLFARW